MDFYTILMIIIMILKGFVIYFRKYLKTFPSLIFNNYRRQKNCLQNVWKKWDLNDLKVLSHFECWWTRQIIYAKNDFMLLFFVRAKVELFLAIFRGIKYLFNSYFLKTSNVDLMRFQQKLQLKISFENVVEFPKNLFWKILRIFEQLLNYKYIKKSLDNFMQSTSLQKVGQLWRFISR